jgi:hypothetical protein
MAYFISLRFVAYGPAQLSTSFDPTFLKKESEAYEITSLSVSLSIRTYVCLSVSVSPLITFEPIGRFL